MIHILEITKEEYIKATEKKVLCFTQRAFWGDVKKEANYIPKYYVIKQDNSVIGAFLSLVKVRSFIFFKVTIGYIPRAKFTFDPLILKQQPDLILEILNKIKKLTGLTLVEADNLELIANQEDQRKWHEDLEAAVNKAGGIFYSSIIQPKGTIIKNTFEENLIETFTSTTTRKNTRRGLRDLEQSTLKFVVKEKLDPKELQQAVELITQAAKSKNFLTRDIDYFQKLQSTASGSIWYLFVDSSKENAIVLANYAIIDSINSINYDLYVGKDYIYDNLYISYLLKYLSFEYLKSIGIKYYDHWGVDLENPSMKGFSQFKIGFGGSIISYPKPFLVGGILKYIALLGINLLKLRGYLKLKRI